mmetsp:Transcript_20734/g.30541  ORF Transcript_20734/g.30541 Transcript_20734/m.30541 type:complete len:286 (-) Transcript_20734:255-1112(-)
MAEAQQSSSNRNYRNQQQRRRGVDGDGSVKRNLQGRGRRPTKKEDANDATYFVQSLTVLNYPDPKKALLCLSTPSKTTRQRSQNEGVNGESDDMDADVALEKLVIWLEEYIIRQWDPKSRQNKLESNFWSFLQQYLFDLDCPPLYYLQPNSFHLNENGEFVIPNDKKASCSYWRYDRFKRPRLIYWIVSCAVSQQYEDSVDHLSIVEHVEVKEEKQPSALPATEKKTSSNEQEPQWKEETFPLGFTTNDEEVDKILTMIRMKYVLNLRNAQNEMNQAIAKKLLSG